MVFRQIHDDQLSQYAYLIGCQETGEALLVDPERDVDRYVEAAEEDALRITAVAETHIHADFLSGARQLAESHDVTLYLSREGESEGWGSRWAKDPGYDAVFLADGDTFRIGNVEVQALHTPGHTPEHLSFLITDKGGGAAAPMGIATGDFVFVGDLGRPDLLESAAGQKGAMKEGAVSLFRSAQQFLEMNDYLQVWPGHGAGSACGKALGSVPATTVGYERRFSPALEAVQEGEDRFVEYILADQPEPPLYFERMKDLNRDGVPLLPELPVPGSLSVEDLHGLDEAPTVIDARPEREAFMRGHLPGALYAPWGESFPTVAGSYVDPDAPIVLVIDPCRVEAATRSLVRLGLDRVTGYVPPDTVAAYADENGQALRTLPMMNMDELECRRQDAGIQVVDVRSRAEYREGHVPGAVNVPHMRLPEQIGDLPRDKTLLVHCGSGQRASSAASLLNARGFEVAHVNDTFANWARAHAGEMEEGGSIAA